MICFMSCTVIVDMLTWLGCAQGTDIDCYHRRPTGALRFSRSHSCHGEFQGKLGCSLRASASSSFRKTPPRPVPGGASRARAKHETRERPHPRAPRARRPCPRRRIILPSPPQGTALRPPAASAQAAGARGRATEP